MWYPENPQPLHPQPLPTPIYPIEEDGEEFKQKQTQVRNENKTDFWITRQIALSYGREVVLKASIRELPVYIVFLTAVSMMVFGMVKTPMYFYGHIMEKVFVDSHFYSPNGIQSSFRSLHSIEELWKYYESVLPDALSWHQQTSSTSTGEILYEIKPIGLPRIRQVRVRNDSCGIHSEYDLIFKECYNYYSDTAEAKEPFGLASGTAWTYSTEASLGLLPFCGKISKYGGGGYYQDLLLDANAIADNLTLLRENLWLSRNTRAVFIHFTNFNPNVNLFCIGKLVAELPPTGGVVTSWQFQTVQLFLYVDRWDFFILGCELTFCFFVIFYTFEEFREFIFFNFRYFTMFWNIFDLTILVVSYLFIYYSEVLYLKVLNKTQILMVETITYANFEQLSQLQATCTWLLATTVFLAWIKLFKYLTINKTLYQLNKALTQCCSDLVGFTFLLLVVFMAFAQFGNVLFGKQVEEFSTVWKANVTLIRILLGEFDYQKIEDVNYILGPLFFLTFIFSVYFILLATIWVLFANQRRAIKSTIRSITLCSTMKLANLFAHCRVRCELWNLDQTNDHFINMFLAILNESYCQVKSETLVGTENLNICDMLLQLCYNLKYLFSKKHPPYKRKAQEMTYADIRRLLLRYGFGSMEIAIFFAKYDIREDCLVGGEEMCSMLADLELICSTKVETAEHNNAIRNRVMHLEGALCGMNTKVDLIVEKLQEISRLRAASDEHEISSLNERSNLDERTNLNVHSDLDERNNEKIRCWFQSWPLEEHENMNVSGGDVSSSEEESDKCLKH